MLVTLFIFYYDFYVLIFEFVLELEKILKNVMHKKFMHIFVFSNLFLNGQRFKLINLQFIRNNLHKISLYKKN